MSNGPQHMTSVYVAPSNLFPPPPNFPDPQVQIFVGDGYSAAMVDQLEAYHIEGVLNVAYDLDDQPQDDEESGMLALAPDPARPAPPPPAAPIVLERYRQQFAKVGLIDGFGNLNGSMSVLAAISMADQLFTFPPNTPNPPLVNEYARGNLLIHCWSGRSRSVTVAALYIWYKFGVELGDPNLASFEQVYAIVKQLRGDPPSGTPPTVGMQAAAKEITSTYRALFPTPVPAG